MLGDLGKLFVAKGFIKLPKVQKITRSGHTECNVVRSLVSAKYIWMNDRTVREHHSTIQVDETKDKDAWCTFVWTKWRFLKCQRRRKSCVSTIIDERFLYLILESVSNETSRQRNVITDDVSPIENVLC